ncbi:MAG: hypothetical protein EOP09_09280, partial [Proteobacteria bacterium]
ERISRIPLSLRNALVFDRARDLGIGNSILPLLVAMEEGERLPRFPLESGALPTSRGTDRLAGKLREQLKTDSQAATPILQLRAFLETNPDRLAKLENGTLKLASGPSFPFTDAEFTSGLYYIFDAEEKESALSIALYAVEPLSLEWLEENFPDQIEFDLESKVDLKRRKEIKWERERWGALILQEWKKESTLDLSSLLPDHEVFDAYLKELAPEASETREFWNELLERVKRYESNGKSVEADFIARMQKELVILLGEVELKDALTTMNAIGDVDWIALNRELPRTIDLPRRKGVKVTYVSGKNPFVESRMQDFFGLKDGPKLLSGSLPITLHLLAPNYRAVQVTEDLMRFWAVHYPELRTPLMRRYPRHQWPEDPRQLIKDDADDSRRK